MRVCVIGGSSGGLYSAIFIKKYHPEYSVDVYEKNEKPGRKLSATGNGKCNLLNKSTDASCYNNREFIRPYLARYGFNDLKDALESIGVSITLNGDLAYPSSLNANLYSSFLYDIARSLGVRFYFGSKVTGYDSTNIIVDGQIRKYDRIVISTGGCSSPKLGSDGSFFDILRKHGYSLRECRPSLVPVRTKEKVKAFSGYRHKAEVSLFKGSSLIRKEAGEVLFKDDGLSGIVIFNLQSEIARRGGNDYRFVLDLFPDESLDDLEHDFKKYKSINPSFYLNAFFPPKFSEYLLSKGGESALAKNCKALAFTYVSSYGFDVSQVTSGGVNLDEIGGDLSSKKEKGVYFVGEVLDIDGVCGGHNLAWCLISALEVAKSI